MGAAAEASKKGGGNEEVHGGRKRTRSICCQPFSRTFCIQIMFDVFVVTCRHRPLHLVRYVCHDGHCYLSPTLLLSICLSLPLSFSLAPWFIFVFISIASILCVARFRSSRQHCPNFGSSPATPPPLSLPCPRPQHVAFKILWYLAFARN